MRAGHEDGQHGEALALVLAAAGASGTAPDDPIERGEWLQGVADLAVELYRSAGDLGAELAILAECRPITGIIKTVAEQSGRAVITIEPTMGSHEEGATEDLRTPWLNERRGAALAAKAHALVGQHCRFGKWVEEVDGGRKKVRMVAWLEPMTNPAGQPAAPASAPAQPPQQQRRDRPAPERPSPPEPPTGGSAHDKLRALRQQQPATSGDVILWAKREFGMEAEQVRQTAADVLKPLMEGATRTPPELQRLWEAIVDQCSPL